MDRIGTSMRANGKVVAGLLAVVLLFITVLVLYWKDIMYLWPGHDTIAIEITTLEGLHKDLDKEIREIQKIRQTREAFIRQGRDFWISKRDGDIESSIIKKIEDVARTSGLKLQNIGNARLIKVNDDISFMEVNIEAKSTMEEISKFIADLYKANPCYYWRRCTIRPFNPRDVKEIVLSGTINVISLTGDGVAKILSEEAR